MHDPLDEEAPNTFTREDGVKMHRFVITDNEGEEFAAYVTDGTLMWEAALEAGVELEHSCGMGQWCGTCVVKMGSGIEFALPEPEADQDVLNTMEEHEIPHESHRLTCAHQVFGPMRVEQPQCF